MVSIIPDNSEDLEEDNEEMNLDKENLSRDPFEYFIK